MIDWKRIKYVFLDMDGTLLDLHFDNHFWLEHLPEHYARVRKVSLEEARRELFAQFAAVEGTLDWYCLDYWSRTLDLDVIALKHEVAHLIDVHSHVVDFLEAVRASNRRMVLLTNAHGKSLALKLQYTGIEGHFDRIISAHELGLAKEQEGFWARLEDYEPYEPTATLMVDDNLDVLGAAARHGVGQVLAVRYPDTRRGAKDTAHYAAIDDFRQVMPVA